MLPKELLEILACPICKGALELNQDQLICQPCGKAYPIRNDIPVLLVEEAKEIETREP